MSTRVALIGYGHAGAVFHAPLILATPGLRLAAVVTRDPERQARARQDVPGAAVVDTADWVWEHAHDHDVVVIATPNRSHVRLARAALEAGLATVVDKPLSPSAGEARDLVNAFARRGVPLTVFQNRRWDGDFLTLRRLLREQRLGDVYRFESRFERWRPQLGGGWRELGDPEEGGGLLLDLGAHLIDQALILFGPVSHVYAELDRRRDRTGADDDSFVALTHASGVRSHLWMTVFAAERGPRFRVLGSRATFTKCGMDVQEDALRAGRRPGDQGWGEDSRDLWGRIESAAQREVVPTERGSYQSFYAELATSLRDGSAPPVDPADSVSVLDVIDAAGAGGGRAGKKVSSQA